MKEKERKSNQIRNANEKTKQATRDPMRYESRQTLKKLWGQESDVNNPALYKLRR